MSKAPEGRGEQQILEPVVMVSLVVEAVGRALIFARFARSRRVGAEVQQ